MRLVTSNILSWHSISSAELRQDYFRLFQHCVSALLSADHLEWLGYPKMGHASTQALLSALRAKCCARLGQSDGAGYERLHLGPLTFEAPASFRRSPGGEPAGMTFRLVRPADGLPSVRRCAWINDLERRGHGESFTRAKIRRLARANRAPGSHPVLAEAGGRSGGSRPARDVAMLLS